MVSSLLNVAYLLPVVGRGFFSKSVEGAGGHGVPQPQSVGAAAAPGSFLSGIREAPAFCVVPLCITAAGCIVLFIYGDALYRLLEPMVRP
jgi:multicomponent Na+:H+ antiporter subunit D